MVSKKRDWGKEFVEAWKNINEGILIAAKIYIEAINEDPANREVIYDAAKGLVTPRDLRQLEAVGKQMMDYRLLLNSCGPHHAKIKKLNSASLQTKVIDGCMFEFLASDGTKKMVLLRECEEYQAKQMFANDHIRTIPEQKNWIESEKIKTNLKVPEMSSSIISTKKGIIVNKAPKFISWKELKRLLLDR